MLQLSNTDIYVLCIKIPSVTKNNNEEVPLFQVVFEKVNWTNL